MFDTGQIHHEYVDYLFVCIIKRLGLEQIEKGPHFQSRD